VTICLCTLIALVIVSILWCSPAAANGAECSRPAPDSKAPNWCSNDFSWVRGANYVPSYAATDVELWLHYDHNAIDCELGYAERIGLNAVRIFLQSLVYHHAPKRFLRNFEDFVSTAAAHGLKVMPVLFDSCFGAAPSIESRHMWVANPGPDRMAEEFWPEFDAYARAVVSRYVGDTRVFMWDVMNEPTATPLSNSTEGLALIDRFVAHYCTFVRQLDPTHPLTVGVATSDNAGVVGLVDVLSCHSYLPGVEIFRKDLANTRDQARAAGKPWLVTECGNPAHGNTYEMVLPVMREYGVGYLIWELMIGRIQFNRQQGLFYPDGTVRRISQVEAVMDGPAGFMQEKPDSEGLPFDRNMRDRVVECVAFAVRNPVTEVTWRERNTMIEPLVFFFGVFGDKKDQVLARLKVAREAYGTGNKGEAFRSVGGLLREAHDELVRNTGNVVPYALLPEKAFVYRDTYGAAHIYADTEAAGMYALAKVQCEDNARQVFENLRRGIGRSAEILGESALPLDELHLRWRVPEVAEAAWNESPLRTKRAIEAFCDGLNDYRNEFPEECIDSLDATPVQVFAWSKSFHVMVAAVIAQAIARNGSVHQRLNGESNAWVIGPSRSASGQPLVLIDPHWPAEGYLRSSEFHLHVGRTQSGGFAIPGHPYAMAGYTTGVAWGGSAGGARSADVFELHVNPINPNQYWFDGTWRDMEIRTATIGVKSNNGIDYRQIKFRETVHGPIIHEEEGKVRAASIGRWKDTVFMEEFLELSRSKTKSELLGALSMDQMAGINLCYGTSSGDFGYVQLGACPLRRERTADYEVLDGARSSALPAEVVPFEQLPQVHNPATGWIQSCNTPANMATSGLTFGRGDFPPGVLFGHYDGPGTRVRWRGARAAEVLSSFGKATIQQACDLALDVFSPSARLWTPALIAAYDAHASDVPDDSLHLRSAVDALRTWDYRVVKESAAPTIYWFWRQEYYKRRPESFGTHGDNELDGYPRSDEEQADAFDALQVAVQRLTDLNRSGLPLPTASPLVPWGQIIRLRKDGLDLPLDGGPFGQQGPETLRATTCQPEKDGMFRFVHGSVLTTVVHLAAPIEVFSVQPYGQSSKPGSSHKTDQMKLFSEGKMRRVWHGWPELRDNIESARVWDYVPRTRQ